MYSVYKHTCPNNKVYIGITKKKVSDRWLKGNGYYNNIHFSRAIKKYGWNNIEHSIIKDNLSLEEACQLEIELISNHKSNNPKYGYNISTGGEFGRSGTKLSEKTKEKIRNSNTGKVRSEETRKNISVAKKGKPSPRKGKKLSEEHKLKISIANRGRKVSNETKKKISQTLKNKPPRKTGYHLSKTHKENISNSLKGKPKSKEHIEKVKLANTGKVFTEEHKRKLSESHLGKKLSDKHKQKIREKLKVYYANKK